MKSIVILAYQMLLAAEPLLYSCLDAFLNFFPDKWENDLIGSVVGSGIISWITLCAWLGTEIVLHNSADHVLALFVFMLGLSLPLFLWFIHGVICHNGKRFLEEREKASTSSS